MRKERCYGNVNGINEIKKRIEQHFGTQFMEKMELMRPIEMEFGIIDDQRLANLYVKIMQKEDETLAQQNERINELLWRAKDQLMLEHSEIVTHLTVGQSTECQNALSRYLANSIGQMKGAKHRLRIFFTSPLKETTISDKLLQENNYFRQVFLSDLTSYEISQLQVKYYLNYMDSDSETDVHTRALFMANLLAFYHWFKKRHHKLSKKMQPYLENLFFKIELQMDFIACSESATDNAAKKAHKREMMSLRSDKDKLFPEEAQVIVIKKGQGNRLNSLETEISLLSMHNEIMEGLIENEQHFLDKITTIFIDEKCLLKTLAYEILMENSKGSKQKKNDNENNGKECEKEKGEEKGGKGREKGEEKEKGDEKTGGKEQKVGEMKPSGEKRKAKEKGEEKGGERGGANGEIEGEGEKERRRQKGRENSGGKGVENEDENTRESDERGEEKEQGEKRKAQEKGEERGGADGEKGEEKDGEIIEERDKKRREKGSESGGAENQRCVDSDADSDLISCYQHLMLADRPISSHDKTFLEVNALYYQLKSLINQILSIIKQIKKAKFDDFHEMDSLYLALFSSTDSDTTFQAEIFLGLKLMVTLIDQAEKAVINRANFTEIITTRAKLRAMMAVQLHFRNAEKFRIICYQIAYVTYLVQKRNLPSKVWQSPTECFLMDREDILSSMRTVLRSSHLNFVMSHVNGGPVGNSISDTVWHKRGALALLEKLIGGTALIKLWENKEARTKLIEANFFLDKKRLVEHYLSALLTSDIAVDSVDRTRRDIKSADLIVWAQWFQSHIEQQHKGKSRHSLNRDYVWMYLRIAYDMYEIGTEKSEFEHTFTKTEKMMRKITKLLISAGASRGSLMGKLREKWDEIITEVFAGSNLELEKSVEKQMDIMEFIQQLHHRLRESENCRNNLTSFLNKEQMREIFRFVGIPLEEKEFEGTAQKMAFPSDDQTETEKGKDQKKKKQRKNRRKKNGQKLGMIEENESEQDQKLFNQMMANGLTNEFAGCLSPAFPKISQQLIRDEFDEQNSQKLEQFVEEKAINGKTADGISRKKRDKRIKSAVDTIKAMAAKWSIDKAKLFISGSFMFGLNTTDSDIDLICVVPGKLEFDINNRGMTTNWHIYPALFQETCQITEKLQEIPAKTQFDFHHCKVWLIGTDQQLLNANEKQLINGQLLNFDWAIKRDFLKYNGKLSNKSGGDDINNQFQQMGLNLKSVFVQNMAHFLQNN
ncbi:hypothetical protein niasHS_016383 [Heterodera schachtii]|uniref:Polymerase nucleotidyl transferase domain-containing protein n=1 Tax=Heterodera schachtii TaxID=97005 RepID=A0ABD2I6A5_HETSC